MTYPDNMPRRLTRGAIWISKRKPMIIPVSNILDAYSNRSQYRNRKPLQY